MNADGRRFKHEQTTGLILKVFYEVYNELGHGFLESVYKKAMLMAPAASGAKVEYEWPITVWFRGQPLGKFSADLLVNDAVIVELKGLRSLEPAHEAQLLNYLPATEIEVGMLLNFGPKPQFKRMAFENSRKKLGKAEAHQAN